MSEGGEQQIKAPARALHETIKEKFSENGMDVIPPQNQAQDSRYIVTSQQEALANIDTFLNGFTLAKALAIRRGMRDLTELKQASEDSFFALPDLVNKFGLQGTNDFFEPTMGSIKLPSQEFSDSQTALSQFFTPDRVFKENGHIELRGANYYVALERRMDHNSRLSIIEQDMEDGIDLISQVDRTTITEPKEYLYYQGVLDYMKSHAMTIYHALTYNERKGDFPQQEEQKIQYLRRKENAKSIMKKLTRMQYQSLLGMEHDDDSDMSDVTEKLPELLNTIKEELNKVAEVEGKHAPGTHFKYPEVHHPLVIALGAQEAVSKNPHSDLIGGIPTGGTETAIVAQMLYEKTHKKSPDLMFLPLSLSSRTKVSNVEEVAGTIIDGNYTGDLEERKVLLIDDNSSSGKTLHQLSRALLHKKVAEVAFHVSEFDGRRWIGHYKEQARDTAAHGDEEPKYSAENTYFNPNVSPSTMGIAQIKRVRHDFLDTVKTRLSTHRQENGKQK